MKKQPIFLRPFRNGTGPAVKIACGIARQCNTLVARCSLLAPLSELAIPSPASTPARKDELWKGTCFEFFLAEKGLAPYWEFNLSPAGDWNVYHFSGYRKGMQEENAFAALPFAVQRKSGSLLLIAEIDLDEILRPDGLLQIGISAVIESKEGELTYWSLTHSGSQPDFHRREAFILEV